MMNTPQLASRFLGVAFFDTARLAVRSFILAITFKQLGIAETDEPEKENT
jgi:hypothetical protein